MNLLYPKIGLMGLLLYAAFEGFSGYGMYTILRFTTFIICGLISFQNVGKRNQLLVWVFGAIAILFNPFVKITFARTTWEMINMSVAIILIASILYEKRNRH